MIIKLEKSKFQVIFPSSLTRTENLLTRTRSKLVKQKKKGMVVIVIAGFDPLRDGAFEYSEKLKNNGVNIINQIHADQFHGFYHMNDVLPEADIAVKQTCDTISMLFKN